MDFRGNIIHTTLIYITWVILFGGAFFCTTMFVLSQHANVDIFEEDPVFLKTSGIRKIEIVSSVNKENVEENNDVIPIENGHDSVRERNTANANALEIDGHQLRER